MRRLLLFLCLLISSASLATEGRIAARTPVIVYDVPSDKGKQVYLLNLGYPLVVLTATSDWYTVCMHDNSVGYVRTRDTRAGEAGIVLSESQVIDAPASTAKIVFNADKGLIVNVDDTPVGDWLPISHESGLSGYIHIKNLFANLAGSNCQ